MNNVTRIVILSLCAALAMSSCTKTNEEVQKIPVGFSALSRTTMVKADGDPTPLWNHHKDFGVWGIARKADHLDYTLWESDALSKVNGSADGIYTPEEEAYWLSGYTYNFIAIAPYDFGGTGLSITPASNTLSFTYDMSGKYAAATPDYDFDLMAAVAETQVDQTKPATQELLFWHLLSKICINVTFKDASGNTVNGNVSEMRLHNVNSEAQYDISFNGTKELAVNCTSNPDETSQLTFGNLAILHIVPQDISDFELFIDFKVEDEDGNMLTMTDYQLDLSGAAEKDYSYNQQYNWNITIGPKADISFKIEVAQWVEDYVQDNDTDDNSDVEII